MYTHGAPASMEMLAAYLHEQERQETWQAYTAQMLWHVNHALYALGGKKFEYPTWLDMTHPQEKDERSGEEIVEDLKATLRERKKKRERRA